MNNPRFTVELQDGRSVELRLPSPPRQDRLHALDREAAALLESGSIDDAGRVVAIWSEVIAAFLLEPLPPGTPEEHADALHDAGYSLSDLTLLALRCLGSLRRSRADMEALADALGFFGRTPSTSPSAAPPSNGSELSTPS